jgi:hypothetical protein
MNLVDEFGNPDASGFLWHDKSALLLRLVAGDKPV